MPELKPCLVCLVQRHALGSTWLCDKPATCRGCDPTFLPMTCRDWLQQPLAILNWGEAGIENGWMYVTFKVLHKYCRSDPVLLEGHLLEEWPVHGLYCTQRRERLWEFFSFMFDFMAFDTFYFGCFFPVEPEESERGAVSGSTRLTCELLKGHNEDASHPL